LGAELTTLKQLFSVVFCLSAVSLNVKNPHTLLFFTAVVMFFVMLYVYVVPLIVSVWSSVLLMKW